MPRPLAIAAAAICLFAPVDARAAGTPVTQAQLDRLAAVGEAKLRWARFYAERKDRRALFAGAYPHSTRSIIAILHWQPDAYENPEAVVEIAERFLSRFEQNMAPIDAYLEARGLWGERMSRSQRRAFRSAMAAERAESAFPGEPWVEAYLAIGARRASALEEALFTLAVHVEYDLTVILCEMLRDLDAEGRAQFARDYWRVNEAMRDAIDGVQDTISEFGGPRLRVIDALGMRLDERLMTRLIYDMRERAFIEATESAKLDPARINTDAASAWTRTPFRRPAPMLRTSLRLLRPLSPPGRRWDKIAR